MGVVDIPSRSCEDRQVEEDYIMAATIRANLLSIVAAIETRFQLPKSRVRREYCGIRKNVLP